MENIYFSNQNEIVIKQLIKDGYNKKDSIELWLKSKTRKKIQDDNKLEHVSGARCYDELQMELSGDPYWLKGSFE